MDAGLALQYAVVALAVTASAAYVLVTRLPATTRRLRGWIALRLVDRGTPWLARMGRRIAPAARPGGGCGSCDGCSEND